jgi:hypothetical protein
LTKPPCSALYPPSPPAAASAPLAQVTEAPNKYEPEVAELSLPQGAAKFVFEIQDSKVLAWRAGLAPTIDYVEHCG